MFLGRFFSSPHTVAAMLFVSLILWGVGAFCKISAEGSGYPTMCCNSINDSLARVLSLLFFVLVAFVLGRLHLFETRLRRLSVVFLCLSSVMIFLHSAFLLALSALLFIVAVAQLISCHQPQGQERALFGAFAFLSFSSLFFLHFLLLLPLFLGYLAIANILNVKNVMAALLGAVTPFWLLLGAVYVFPELDVLLLPTRMAYVDIMAPVAHAFSLLTCVVFAMEVLVWVVALYGFFSSSLPAKPLLRRRLIFFFLSEVYLLMLSFILPQDYMLLLSWRLPIVAVMFSYFLALGVNRISNIYFITLNFVWLSIAAICLWIG